MALFDITPANTIPDTLYRVVVADDALFDEDVYVSAMSATYDTVEMAEAFIMAYGIPHATYNIVEYVLPPF